MTTKTDIRSFYDKDFIGSWDLPEGKDAVLIIDHVEGGSIHNMRTNKKDKRPLVFFRNVREPKKPLVLNPTNRQTIIGMYGKFIEDWVGKPIALYKTDVAAFGGTTEGIRVRPTAPAMPSARNSGPPLSGIPREPGDEDLDDKAASS